MAALTAQLAHLRPSEGEEQSFERALYILQSLSTVRSCVIVAEMAGAGGDDDAEEPLITLFETLLDAIQ